MSKVKAPKIAKQINLPDEEYNKMWSREKEFKFIKAFEDPRFGKVTIVKNHKTGEILMAKEKLLDNKSRATKDIVELKQRMNLNHPNLMELVGYSTSVKKNLCSTHYISRAFFRYPKTDMDREFKMRQKNTTEFSGNELQALGLNSLRGLNHLHEKGLHHGDVRPKYLGFDKANNNNAVLDRMKDPSPIEVTQRNNLMTKNIKNYMSPQLYNKLQGHDKNQKYDKQKNDMWSLGMSMLQMGTMDSVEDVYQKDGKINKIKLKEHMDDFDNRYRNTNPALVSTVHSLLSENEENRPTSGQLLGQISGGNFSVPQQRVVNSTPQQLPTQQEVVNEGGMDFFNNRQENVVNANPNTNVHVQEDNPYMQSTNFFQAPKTNYVQSTPQTNYVQQPQTNTTYIQQQTLPTTTYVNTEPQVTYMNQQPTYVQSTPQTTYVQSQPQTTYVNNQTQISNEPTLLRTYVDDSNAQINTTSTTNFTNYVENQPTQTYVQSTPQYTQYVDNQPSNVQYTENRVENEVQNPTYTYVNQQPTTVQYSEPQTRTYVNAEPQVTYTQQPTTTYVNAEPQVTYTQPTTTYVNAEPQVTYTQQPTTTYVNAEPQVTYTQQPTTTYVNAEPQVTYTQQPTTTYVQSTPQYTNTTFINADQENKVTYVNDPQTTTYVNAEPQVTYMQNQPTYVQSTPQTYTNNTTTTFVNAQPGTTQYTNQTHTTQTVNNGTSYYQGGQSQLNGDVEIRRGSYIPPQNTGQVISEKKRYVMQDDGTVIEVDPNTELENA